MQSLWMLAASLLFALMAACSKMGAEHFGTFELVFWRSIFGTAVIMFWALKTGNALRTPLIPAHLKRSFLGTFALTIWFFAIAYLPLGTAMTLNYTSPLYMAAFITMAAWRRHETIDWGLVSTVLTGFLGITLVLRPEVRGGDEIPALVGLASGFFAALAYKQVKELSVMREPEWRIVFYFTLFGTIWGFGGQLCMGGLTPVTWESAPALLGMAVTGTAAQLCMTRAWGAGNMLLTSTLQFSAIVFAATLGLLLFNEPISVLSACGIIVIIASGVAATMLTRRHAKH